MVIGHSAKSGCPFLYAILPIEESNRRFSVWASFVRSIGHALAAWQTGILQSQGARFCMLSFRSESLIAGSASRPFRSGNLIAGSASSPLQPQHRPYACRMANGHPAKSGYSILYAILSIGESNRRFSVQPPSNRSIGHALIAWQSGILQKSGCPFLYAILPIKEPNRRFSVQPPPSAA